MAGNRRQCVLSASRARGGILRRVGDATSRAAVGVTHKYPPELVHGDIVEIEKITARVAASLVPDAASLHWVRGSSVNGRPSEAGVVSEGRIQVPDPLEVGRLRITRGLCAEEGKGRALIVAGDHFGELRVLDSERSPRILGLRPVQAAVAGNRNLGVAVGVHIPEVYGVVRSFCDRRVRAGTDALAVRHSANHPAQTTVRRNGHARPTNAVGVEAVFVGNVDGAVRRNTHVAVQTAASARRNGNICAVDMGEGINGNAGPEGRPAVIAARAERCHNVLRTVINPMRVPRWRQRRWKGVRTSAHCLMVDARRLAGPLRWKPGVAIVVAEGKLAGDKDELRRKQAIWAPKVAVVNEHDRVQAHSREERTLVLPERRSRIDAVVESHAKSMVSRLDERFARVPVDSNGWLPRAVLSGSCRARRRLYATRGLLRSRAIVGSRIIDESWGSRSCWRRHRRRGPRCDHQRNRHVSRGGHRGQRGYRANVPESVNRIGDREILLAWSGGSVVRRAWAVVRSAGADGKDVQIRGQRARPRVLKGELGRHRLIERGRGGGEHHGQVVVIAQAGRADILYPHVYHRSAAHRTEVPCQRPRTTTDRAAGRRSELRPRSGRVSDEQHCGRSEKQDDE